MEDPYTVRPFKGGASGIVELPGSKSITNRALILGALGAGELTLKGALISEDTRLMVEGLENLGYFVSVDEVRRSMVIEGRGGVVPNSKASIYVGNAGTVARFLVALVSLRAGGHYYFDGNEAMRTRPMWGLLDVLENMGAIEVVYHEERGCMPFSLKIKGLGGGRVTVDGESTSQFISALLMVAPYSYSPMEVSVVGKVVSLPYIEMTKRMIKEVAPGGIYSIEGDASAGSYFLALVGILGGEVNIRGFPRKEGLQGDANFLEVMGVEHEFYEGGVTVRGKGGMEGGVYDFCDISDTFMTLAAIAPLMKGEIEIRGIRHTRGKETDRISAVAMELIKLGQEVEEYADGILIRPRELRSGVEIETYGDHRMAMSFGVLGSYDLHGDGRGWLSIKNPTCCGKTFPQYFEQLEALRHDRK